MLPISSRVGGLAAMLGSALGILVAPVITSAYSIAEGKLGQAPPWEPPLIDVFRAVLVRAP